MRFIHTADWQIGKPFRNFGEQESVLRQARLKAIETIGELALRQNAPCVLIAGDLYDTEAPSTKTMLEPIERMKRFPGVAWHVIPGNHDPHRANGLWDRLRQSGLPSNLHVHVTPEPVVLEEAAVLLPAPLRRKSEVSDLTQWMEGAATPGGHIRIGLAHGSVTGFGGDGEASNPVAPDRAQRAGLSYLALGDWHRTVQINAATWYSGTPEPDRFGSQETGQVLLVEINGPGEPAKVTPHATGSHRWLTLSEDVSGEGAIADLDLKIRALPGLSSTILRLVLTGTLALAARAEIDRRVDGLSAALCHLDCELEGLTAQPSASDLETIDFGGVLREAAETLKAMAENAALPPQDRRRAEDALVRLFVMSVARP